VVAISLRVRAELRRRVRGFGYAGRGIWIATGQSNFRIHCLAAVVVAYLAAAYGITGAHLGLVVTSVALVAAMEIMNTAVERLCDFVAQLHGIGRDERIRDVKDLAAGAVLVVALGAAANGLIVFGPHLG